MQRNGERIYVFSGVQFDPCHMCQPPDIPALHMANPSLTTPTTDTNSIHGCQDPGLPVVARALHTHNWDTPWNKGTQEEILL